MKLLKLLFARKAPSVKAVSRAILATAGSASEKAEAKPSTRKVAAAIANDRFEYAADLLDQDETGYFIEPEDSFDLDIVGEASYQKELEVIAGAKTERGVKFTCKAILKCEADNQFDKNAVQVFISDSLVGYLAKGDAKLWRQMLRKQNAAKKDVRVNAMIVGGWKANAKKGQSDGHFGVKLDIPVSNDD